MKVNYEQLTEDCVQWIRDWFDKNGKNCNAVIGLSGGKDSTVVAGLCVKALGKDRVIGVSMPESSQGLNEADKIAAFFDIPLIVAPIGPICEEFYATPQEMQFYMARDSKMPSSLEGSVTTILNNEWSLQSRQNIPPRIRMAMLYAISQSCNGRPSCNCNLSEDWVGYATLFGDNAASFAPIAKLTVTEVKEIGRVLGIPDKWVDKTPDDGLPNSCPDEEKFGFSYATLDKYIREGICEDENIKYKIDMMNEKNLFKLDIVRIPTFIPNKELWES